MTLTGLFVPLITPFDAAGEVALGALDALANQVLDDGASGLVALGTTAEPTSLTAAEQRAVVDVVARVCRERASRLLVGASTLDRPEATAALSVVPPFVRPGEDGVVAHFTRLAADSALPLVVYDVPHRTGQYLSANALRRLAAVPGVVGLKYAPGGINADTVALFADPPPGLSVLGGDDAFLSPLLALGAHGGITASAHVATATFAGLVEAWRTGDVATARTTGRGLATLSTALFAEPNPTVIKAVLHARGRIPTADVRLPLLPAHPTSTEAALRALDAITPARHTAYVSGTPGR